MTVYENMAFALKLRHTPKDEIDRAVKQAAEILDITQYLNRKPKALSNGSQVGFSFPGHCCHVFHKDTGINLEA